MGLIFLGGLVISMIFDIGALILAITGLIFALIYAFSNNKK